MMHERYPNFNVVLQTTINSALEDSLIWPVRIIIPIIPGDYRCLFFLLIIPILMIECQPLQVLRIFFKFLFK